jgi:hypothetical protein
VLLNVVVQQGNGTGYASFDNPSWPGANFTTRGALIYNSTKANKSIGVLNFGLDQTMTNQGFEIHASPSQISQVFDPRTFYLIQSPIFRN